jgi:hypothetical protein
MAKLSMQLRRATMKTISATLAAGLMIAVGIAGTAHASSASGGYVTNVYSMENGAVLFHHDGVRTSPLPGCQGPGLGTRWAFSVNTPAGQARLAILLSAYATHRKVQIIGKGTCLVEQSDTEEVSFLLTNDN